MHAQLAEDVYKRQILDTVNYAVTLLEMQPKDFRRVLLLISEERDHGSKHTKPAQLIEKIGESDVLVLSVSFSPALAELGHDVDVYKRQLLGNDTGGTADYGAGAGQAGQ